MIRYGNIKILVDPAMGKLVRWMRLLGYDTFYMSSLNAHHLCKVAKNEYRILLSCSEKTLKIAEKKNISAFFLPNSNLQKQLEELVRIGFEISLPDFSETRCSNCNNSLSLATIEEENQLLEEGTKKIFSEFFICRSCDQIYWEGSHWDNIKASINQLKK